MGWAAIVSDLRAAGIAAEPDVEAPARMEEDLRGWRADEYLPRVPQGSA
jgi:hypothetical protein